MPWVNYIYSVDEENKYIDKIENDWKNNKKFTFLIKLKDNLNIIGIVAVIRINKKMKKCEIGYWLGKEYYHKGYMTESITKFEEFLFKSNFRQTIIRCDSNNYNSIAVAKRNGYKNFIQKIILCIIN